MIHYYTELLGMRDTIAEEDLYVDVSKTQLERELNNKGNEINVLQDQLTEQNKEMAEMKDLMKTIQKSLQLETVRTYQPNISPSSLIKE